MHYRCIFLIELTSIKWIWMLILLKKLTHVKKKTSSVYIWPPTSPLSYLSIPLAIHASLVPPLPFPSSLWWSGGGPLPTRGPSPLLSSSRAVWWWRKPTGRAGCGRCGGWQIDLISPVLKCGEMAAVVEAWISLALSLLGDLSPSPSPPLAWRGVAAGWQGGGVVIRSRRLPLAQGTSAPLPPPPMRHWVAANGVEAGVAFFFNKPTCIGLEQTYRP